MPQSLEDYAQRQKQGVPQSLDLILDEDVTVEEVEFRNGDYGEYAVMDVVVKTGEVVRVQSGAMLVMDALRNAEAANALPIEAKFVKEGRLYLVK